MLIQHGYSTIGIRLAHVLIPTLIPFQSVSVIAPHTAIQRHKRLHIEWSIISSQSPPRGPSGYKLVLRRVCCDAHPSPPNCGSPHSPPSFSPHFSSSLSDFHFPSTYPPCLHSSFAVFLLSLSSFFDIYLVPFISPTLRIPVKGITELDANTHTHTHLLSLGGCLL